MQINPFQASCPQLEIITSPDMFFGTVKEDYPDYKASGFFQKTGEECLYIYRIKDDFRTFTGIIACVSIEDYAKGLIKKHENTLAAKEQQQLHLILRRKAMVKPVLLTYEPIELIDRFMRDFIERFEPFMQINFEIEKQDHYFWKVKEKAHIDYLAGLFKQHVPHSYIADGHHRTSITSIMHDRSTNGYLKGSYNQLLAAFFSSNEVQVLDFNRIVEGLAECSTTTFMALLSKIVDIDILEIPTRPKQKHEMVMYINREWFLLKWKEEILDRFADEPVLLDVHLLNELIIKDILKIEDVRTDFRVRYIDGTKGLEGLKEKVLKSEHRVGFVLHPIDLRDFMEIADHNKVLPPKSTWFEPRMRNGLIVQEF